MKKSALLLLLLSLSTFLYAQNFDIDLLRKINLGRNKDLDALFICITNTAAYIAYILPFLFLLTGLKKKDPLIRQKAYYMGATVLTSGIISTLLKYIIARPSPFDIYAGLEKITVGGSFSFPSGHTADAFALATALCFAWPRWYVIIPAFAWAGTVGYSRIDLGVHYPSDVLAGIVIGAGTAIISFFVLKWMLLLWRKREK
jgi:membrane-associated phospholipid phosphatase